MDASATVAAAASLDHVNLGSKERRNFVPFFGDTVTFEGQTSRAEVLDAVYNTSGVRPHSSHTQQGIHYLTLASPEDVETVLEAPIGACKTLPLMAACTLYYHDVDATVRYAIKGTSEAAILGKVNADCRCNIENVKWFDNGRTLRVECRTPLNAKKLFWEGLPLSGFRLCNGHFHYNYPMVESSCMQYNKREDEYFSSKDQWDPGKTQTLRNSANCKTSLKIKKRKKVNRGSINMNDLSNHQISEFDSDSLKGIFAQVLSDTALYFSKSSPKKYVYLLQNLFKINKLPIPKFPNCFFKRKKFISSRQQAKYTHLKSFKKQSKEKKIKNYNSYMDTRSLNDQVFDNVSSCHFPEGYYTLTTSSTSESSDECSSSTDYDYHLLSVGSDTEEVSEEAPENASNKDSKCVQYPQVESQNMSADWFDDWEELPNRETPKLHLENCYIQTYKEDDQKSEKSPFCDNQSLNNCFDVALDEYNNSVSIIDRQQSIKKNELGGQEIYSQENENNESFVKSSKNSFDLLSISPLDSHSRSTSLTHTPNDVMVESGYHSPSHFGEEELDLSAITNCLENENLFSSSFTQTSKENHNFSMSYVKENQKDMKSTVKRKIDSVNKYDFRYQEKHNFQELNIDCPSLPSNDWDCTFNHFLCLDEHKSIDVNNINNVDPTMESQKSVRRKENKKRTSISHSKVCIMVNNEPIDNSSDDDTCSVGGDVHSNINSCCSDFKRSKDFLISYTDIQEKKNIDYENNMNHLSCHHKDENCDLQEEMINPLEKVLVPTYFNKKEGSVSSVLDCSNKHSSNKTTHDGDSIYLSGNFIISSPITDQPFITFHNIQEQICYTVIDGDLVESPLSPTISRSSSANDLSGLSQSDSLSVTLPTSTFISLPQPSMSKKHVNSRRASLPLMYYNPLSSNSNDSSLNYYSEEKCESFSNRSLSHFPIERSNSRNNCSYKDSFSSDIFLGSNQIVINNQNINIDNNGSILSNEENSISIRTEYQNISSNDFNLIKEEFQINHIHKSLSIDVSTKKVLDNTSDNYVSHDSIVKNESDDKSVHYLNMNGCNNTNEMVTVSNNYLSDHTLSTGYTNTTLVKQGDDVKLYSKNPVETRRDSLPPINYNPLSSNSSDSLIYKDLLENYKFSSNLKKRKTSNIVYPHNVSAKTRRSSLPIINYNPLSSNALPDILEESCNITSIDASEFNKQVPDDNSVNICQRKYLVNNYDKISNGLNQSENKCKVPCSESDLFGNECEIEAQNIEIENISKDIYQREDDVIFTNIFDIKHSYVRTRSISLPEGSPFFNNRIVDKLEKKKVDVECKTINEVRDIFNECDEDKNERFARLVKSFHHSLECLPKVTISDMKGSCSLQNFPIRYNDCISEIVSSPIYKSSLDKEIKSSNENIEDQEETCLYASYDIKEIMEGVAIYFSNYIIEEAFMEISTNCQNKKGAQSICNKNAENKMDFTCLNENGSEKTSSVKEPYACMKKSASWNGIESELDEYSSESEDIPYFPCREFTTNLDTYCPEIIVIPSTPGEEGETALSNDVEPKYDYCHYHYSPSNEYGNRNGAKNTANDAMSCDIHENTENSEVFLMNENVSTSSDEVQSHCFRSKTVEEFGHEWYELYGIKQFKGTTSQPLEFKVEAFDDLKYVNYEKNWSNSNHNTEYNNTSNIMSYNSEGHNIVNTYTGESQDKYAYNRIIDNSFSRLQNITENISDVCQESKKNSSENLANIPCNVYQEAWGELYGMPAMYDNYIDSDSSSISVTKPKHFPYLKSPAAQGYIADHQANIEVYETISYCHLSKDTDVVCDPENYKPKLYKSTEEYENALYGSLQYDIKIYKTVEEFDSAREDLFGKKKRMDIKIYKTVEEFDLAREDLLCKKKISMVRNTHFQNNGFNNQHNCTVGEELKKNIKRVKIVEECNSRTFHDPIYTNSVSDIGGDLSFVIDESYGKPYSNPYIDITNRNYVYKNPEINKKPHRIPKMGKKVLRYEKDKLVNNDREKACKYFDRKESSHNEFVCIGKYREQDTGDSGEYNILEDYRFKSVHITKEGPSKINKSGENNVKFIKKNKEEKRISLTTNSNLSSEIGILKSSKQRRESSKVKKSLSDILESPVAEIVTDWILQPYWAEENSLTDSYFKHIDSHCSCQVKDKKRRRTSISLKEKKSNISSLNDLSKLYEKGVKIMRVISHCLYYCIQCIENALEFCLLNFMNLISVIVLRIINFEYRHIKEKIQTMKNQIFRIPEEPETKIIYSKISIKRVYNSLISCTIETSTNFINYYKQYQLFLWIKKYGLVLKRSSNLKLSTILRYLREKYSLIETRYTFRKYDSQEVFDPPSEGFGDHNVRNFFENDPTRKPPTTSMPDSTKTVPSSTVRSLDLGSSLHLDLGSSLRQDLGSSQQWRGFSGSSVSTKIPRLDPHVKKQEYSEPLIVLEWRAHTLTTLFVMICFLLYESLSPPDEDIIDNTKRGLLAIIAAFILLGVTVTPDGPFKRPHPAVWRFTFICSIVYELGLIFALYQSASGVRQLLKHIDPKLGEPLTEKSYGGNCLLVDPETPSDPYHNIWDKLDLFVPLHLFGWWLKTLLLRDWWLCTVISIMFEALEYTFEHQLPNFSECWWDHWIMDALVCNGLGIVFGIWTLQYFSMKEYHWRGLWNIPTYRGKLRRIVGQFGPFVWVDYDWKPMSTLGRWFATVGIIGIFLLAELNTFYLKFVLWIDPGHWLNLVRLFCILPWGAVSLREVFQYLDDPDCTKFGRQSWLFLSIVCTEFLIVIKFGWETVTIPFPRHIVILWIFFFIGLILWTCWNFVIDPHTFKIDAKDVELRRDHWNQLRAIEIKLSPSEPRFLPQFFSGRSKSESKAETIEDLEREKQE